MKGKKVFEKLSVTEYAERREITPRAVQKMIVYINKNKIPLPDYRLPGVMKLEPLGHSYILHIKTHSNDNKSPIPVGQSNRPPKKQPIS